MGTTSSVTIVHSSKVDEDSDALLSIFPGRFQVEKYEGSSVLTLIEEQLTLMVVPSQSSKMTHTALVLEDDVIAQASERAKKYGLAVKSQSIMGYSAVKLAIPGGATLVAAPTKLWADPSARSTLVQRMFNATVRAQVTTSSPPDIGITKNVPVSMYGDTDANTGGSQNQRRQSFSLRGAPPPLTSLQMQRSMSMTDLPNVNASRATPINRLHPTIRVEVLNARGSFDPLQLNPQTAVPVETELFVGKLLLLMKPATPEDDPFWNERIFSKKKRRCVMQLQGKLKYTPNGELFAGMEIADPMNLGLMASGLCQILLKLVAKFNPHLFHSFGTSTTRPHICFPASTFFERVISTPPGEEPPPLNGVEFYEPPDSIKARKAYKTRVDWNDKSTYSLSFHSMYMDFPTWKVVNLPVKDMNLHTFWGNSPSSVVFYENTGSSREHATELNKYVMSVRMEHLGEQANTVEAFDDRTSQAESSVDADFSSLGDTELLSAVDEGVDSDEIEFFDTIQSHSSMQEVVNEVTEISPSSPYMTTLRVIDEHCPCFIDMFSKKGKYSTVYAFKGPRGPIFRPWDTTLEYFGDSVPAEITDGFSSRLSSRERCRRILGLRYAEIALGKASPRSLSDFQNLATRHDDQFLSRELPAIETNSSRRVTGFVARALSDRHWREELGVITDDELLFYHIGRSKPTFRMSLASVVKVEPLPDADRPLLSTYHFLSVESFGRTMYLMLASEAERDSWTEAIRERKLVPQEKTTPNSNSFTNHLIEVDEPMQEFLHKSTLWDCNKRRILNCRRYSFRAPIYDEQPDSLGLVQKALELATSLQPKGPNDRDLEDFLDCAAALKEADARTLVEEERLAFFLNLYHVMIMHAYIVLGPPDSGPKWVSYFNTIAYQCSDDIFSLAELEHNIIRAEMSYPSQFLSRFILPKSTFPFALTKKDFRINFALNCGSMSMPSGNVPIYDPVTVDKQLDDVTIFFLNHTVEVASSRISDVVISLPKVCQWFSDDFGSTSNNILLCIEPYLSESKRTTMKTLWNEKKMCYEIGLWNLRFLPYSFECRFLSLET